MVRASLILPPEIRYEAWLRFWGELGEYHAETAKLEMLYPRPKIRAECVDGHRPCPFASCRHHLYLEVVIDTDPETRKESGRIKFNHGQIEIDEMGETCSLDVADRDGVTLEVAGRHLGLTRERIRQLEALGLKAMKELAPDLDEED